MNLFFVLAVALILFGFISMCLRNVDKDKRINNIISAIINDHGGISPLLALGIFILLLLILWEEFGKPLLAGKPIDLVNMALLGDTLAPYVSVTGSILVLIGLIYTVRDFRHARLEFQKISKAQLDVVKIEHHKYKNDIREKTAQLKLAGIHEFFDSLQKLTFRDLKLSILIEADEDEDTQQYTRLNSTVAINSTEQLLILADCYCMNDIQARIPAFKVIENESQYVDRQIKLLISDSAHPAILRLARATKTLILSIEEYASLVSRQEYYSHFANKQNWIYNVFEIFYIWIENHEVGGELNVTVLPTRGMRKHTWMILDYIEIRKKINIGETFGKLDNLSFYIDKLELLSE